MKNVQTNKKNTIKQGVSVSHDATNESDDANVNQTDLTQNIKK